VLRILHFICFIKVLLLNMCYLFLNHLRSLDFDELFSAFTVLAPKAVELLMCVECRRFLASLEDSGCEAVKVAQCFVDQFDEFIIYAEYCTNYPRSDHYSM